MNDYDLIFMCEKRRVKWTTFTVCSIWIALLWANFAFAVHFSTSYNKYCCKYRHILHEYGSWKHIEWDGYRSRTSFKNSHIHIDKQTNQPYYYTHFHNFSGRTVNRQNNERWSKRFLACELLVKPFELLLYDYVLNDIAGAFVYLHKR